MFVSPRTIPSKVEVRANGIADAPSASTSAAMWAADSEGEKRS